MKLIKKCLILFMIVFIAGCNVEMSGEGLNKSGDDSASEKFDPADGGDLGTLGDNKIRIIGYLNPGDFKTGEFKEGEAHGYIIDVSEKSELIFDYEISDKSEKRPAVAFYGPSNDLGYWGDAIVKKSDQEKHNINLNYQVSENGRFLIVLSHEMSEAKSSPFLSSTDSENEEKTPDFSYTIALGCVGTCQPGTNCQQVLCPETCESGCEVKDGCIEESCKTDAGNEDSCELEKQELVCGSDDKTYMKPCLAKKAGITDFTDGKCTEKKCNSDKDCPANFICDENACAEEPEDDGNTCICTKEFMPVCGADDKTYGNECELKCSGEKKAYDGECKGKIDCRTVKCANITTCKEGFKLVKNECCNSCEPIECKSDADCTKGFECKKSISGTSGICQSKQIKVKCGANKCGECLDLNAPQTGTSYSCGPLNEVDKCQSEKSTCAFDTATLSCEWKDTKEFFECVEDAEEKRCVKEGTCPCAMDNDCPGELKCDTKKLVCVKDMDPQKFCKKNDDCKSGEICNQGQCEVKKGCFSDKDCMPGESCNSSAQTCEPQTCICPQNYRPVCGDDGNTYSNKCNALCANVNVDYEGECKQSCACTREYKPVCGKDGQTYPNKCQAKCASQDIDYEGECKSSCVCTTDYKPVCGTDNVTYSNACEAGCAGVKVDFNGECGANTGGTTGGNSSGPGTCTCPYIFDPVCGDDGNTYSNECEAKCAGSKVDYKGDCKTNGGNTGTSTGGALPKECKSDFDCAPEESCQKVPGGSAYCAPRGCLSDSECDKGEECLQFNNNPGVCRPKGCKADTECADYQYCRTFSWNPNGQGFCDERSCKSNNDCPGNSKCEKGFFGRGECAPK